MRKRPLALILCALSFLYFPTELFWRMRAGEPVLLGDLLFSVVFPILLLVGLLYVTRVGWYSLIAFAALWGFRDIYFFYSSQGSSLTPILIHLLIYMLSLAYFINPRIRHLYFDPKLRWWRTKRRFETHGPVIVKVGDNWEYPVMRNISEGGCFIETSHTLPVEERIKVSIPLSMPLAVSVIQAEGEVRWISGGPLRSGMGIQFRNLDRKHARAVKSYVRRQL